jgi:(1->4)-alpha-D-glucan 1-alpha-D-glucosylmutase
MYGPPENAMDASQLAETLLVEAADMVAARSRLPESTYRLQFHAGFTFRDALGIVPYLYDLGITHCYASPYLKARPGSTHGYDIVDHNALNPEIGTVDDYEAWVAALRAHGLGQILDTVPNHMGVGTSDNAWWNDVLENGPASRYGAHFDIAWRSSPRLELQDRVLLPVLGEPYGEVLEAGQLRLTFANGAFSIHYHDFRFPVAPHRYDRILGHRLNEWERSTAPDDPELMEYQSILTAVRNLPYHVETDPVRVAERHREKEVVKSRLASLAADSETARAFIDENVAVFNGRPGVPRSFDLLDELLEHQCYRLAYWRVAQDEINYRRFFDINDLAALSMERPDVFEAAHDLIIRLLADGKLDGLRVDHPDGLYDPAQYFRRLHEHFILACARKVLDADPAAEGLDRCEVESQLRRRFAAQSAAAGRDRLHRPLYVVAEKILVADEALVETWPVHGTSGYDFLNQVNGLFVDGASATAFGRLYADLIQDSTRFPEVAYRGKRLIMQVSLAAELHTLTHQLDRLAQRSRLSRDFTFNTLGHALREIIACFPVYRSYIDDDGAHEADRRQIATAVRRATARNPLLTRRVFGFIRDMLLLESPASFGDADRAEQRQFAGKFQQVTAPVMAKGVEDTAFYIYNCLVSLNEVGGDPGRFGVRPEALHAYYQARQAKWPYALSPLSTHDTKRSEDVRARINALSEMPEEWRACLQRWGRLNEGYKVKGEDQMIPDSNEEYLLYQTLVGAWPLEPCTLEEYADFVKRIRDYMLKAVHEAKVHSSWINPNAEYDDAVQQFVGRILDEQSNGAFLDDFRAFQRRVSHYGMFNSLSQTLLRVTAPGVPDTYQGTELWDYSLTDPDNRRPVDYASRQRVLRELQAAVARARGDLRELARALVADKEDGRVKLFVTWRSLRCRRDRPGLFSAGEYIPLLAEGAKALHLFAFARRAADGYAVAAVPRLPARLVPEMDQPPLGEAVWNATRLFLPEVDPSWRWRNIFTGESLAHVESAGQLSLAAAELFAHFPVALLLAYQPEPCENLRSSIERTAQTAAG